MTAIVGLVQNRTVYIGGDSAGASGYSLTVRADSKVFRNGRYLFGFTESFRMGQLIRYAFTPPQPPKKAKNLDLFMSTRFIDSLRKCLKTGGWATRDSGREVGGTFLVGVSGRLFTIYSDYQVAQAADGFAAVGCGESLALGALYATAGLTMAPKRRIKTALRAAERFNTDVCGPFVCLSLKPS